jgi:uncharacterized protein YkwD
MKNSAFVWFSLTALFGCISRQELAKVEQELVEVRNTNKILKTETRLFKDSQILFQDTLEKLRLQWSRVTENRKNKARQAMRFADSMKIENCTFATREEKNAYHYLNYARTRPREFCERFVVPNWDKRNSYENSLVQTMRSMSPVPPVFPEKSVYESALCHARVSGKIGYVGHNRQTDPKTRKKCTSFFMGECCSYGYDDGLGVILQLLIDNGVPSLGHRKICLSEGYSVVGISIQSHERYGFNCVLDFM